MSKDFGIAGLRVGYAVMTSELRQKYMKSGFLWNSNGLAYYFTTLLADKEFQKEYKKAKSTYNSARDDFFTELQKIPGLKVYPSQANFFMLETEEDAGLLFTKLLYTHGIYTRILNDKWGLKGNFIRIASKDRKENRKMLHALKTIFK
jgi:histidinol-phosphate/aromatic aminotransferase/cobyric acid decarboxylase-like protein